MVQAPWMDNIKPMIYRSSQLDYDLFVVISYGKDKVNVVKARTAHVMVQAPGKNGAPMLYLTVVMSYPIVIMTTAPYEGEGPGAMEG